MAEDRILTISDMMEALSQFDPMAEIVINGLRVTSWSIEQKNPVRLLNDIDDRCHLGGPQMMVRDLEKSPTVYIQAPAP